MSLLRRANNVMSSSSNDARTSRSRYSDAKATFVVNCRDDFRLSSCGAGWRRRPAERVSTRSYYRRLQQTNDAALGSSLLYGDCLSISVQGDPA